MSPNDESAHKKRRISQACETCRKRKSKCDGGQPVCSICLSNNRVCTYDHGGRKRGLQSGYVRSMETILDVLIQDLPEVEDKVRVLLRSAEIADKIVKPLLAEKVTTTWHNSALHEDVKVLLDHAEDDIQTAIDFLPNMEEHNSSSTTVAPSPVFESSSASTSNIQPTSDGCLTMNILDNASELIDLYFLHIHHMFPMIERRDILYILHNTNDHATMTSIDKGHFTCLLSMLALTLVCVKQVHEDDVRVQQTLKCVNLELIDTDRCFEIGHIQAALLQSLLKTYLGQYDASWICLGQATRQIEVYTEKHNSRTSRVSLVIQTCNILDTFVSTICGRSSHVSLRSCQSSVDVDGLEEWEEWQTSTSSSEVHTADTRLPVHALSVFCNIAYIMSRIQILDLKSLTVQSCESELKHFQSWWKTLPAYCNPPDPTKTPPSVAHLQLFFHFAIITVSVNSGASMMAPHALKDAARATSNLIEGYIDVNRCDFAFLKPFSLHCINSLSLATCLLDDPEIKDLEHRLYGIHSKLRSRFGSSITECELPIHQPESSESHRIQKLPRTISQPGMNAFDPDILKRTSCNPSIELQSRVSDSAVVDTDARAENASIESQHRSDHGVNMRTSASYTAMMENEFDTLLDTETESYLNASFSFSEDHELVSHNEFVQNLGFLDGSMDAEFLALINHDFVST